MLKLKDLILLSGIQLLDFKIHCATGRINPPIEAFYDGKFKEWQEHQNNKNFQCAQIVSLINIFRDKWLFAGVFQVNGVKEKIKMKKRWYEYSTSEIIGLDHLTGKVIINFDKKFRASYLKGNKFIDQLIIAEIKPEKMSIGDFPGFNSVLLSNKLLRTIVRENLPTWKSALCNVAGVYVIVDKKTGKHYVGSANGGEGIWQRWVCYSKDGHGGNKELKQILAEKGIDYVTNFQYSILEVCDINSKDDHIKGREKHWKDVLCTREFGYNKN